MAAEQTFEGFTFGAGPTVRTPAKPRRRNGATTSEILLWYAAMLGCFIVIHPLLLAGRCGNWCLEVAPRIVFKAMWRGTVRTSRWFLLRSWRQKRVLYALIVLCIAALYTQHVWVRTALGEGSGLEASLLAKISAEEVTARDVRIAKSASECSRYTRNYAIPSSGKREARDRKTLVELLKAGAPSDVQEQTALAHLREAHRAGLSREQTTALLAVLEVESGFSPIAMPYDEKRGWLSSAAGPSQLIVRTAQGLELDPNQRLTFDASARATVQLFVASLKQHDILEAAERFVGQDRAEVIFAMYYPYHRDPRDLDSPITAKKIEEGRKYIAKLYPIMAAEPFQVQTDLVFENTVYAKTQMTLEKQARETYARISQAAHIAWSKAVALFPSKSEDERLL